MNSPFYQRCETMNIRCHSWLNTNEILIGIEYGLMYIINRHGEIIRKYDMSLSSIDVFPKKISSFSFFRCC